VGRQLTLGSHRKESLDSLTPGAFRTTLANGKRAAVLVASVERHRDMSDAEALLLVPAGRLRLWRLKGSFAISGEQ